MRWMRQRFSRARAALSARVESRQESWMEKAFGRVEKTPGYVPLSRIGVSDISMESD